jgi:hypothetical protein
MDSYLTKEKAREKAKGTRKARVKREGKARVKREGHRLDVVRVVEVARKEKEKDMLRIHIVRVEKRVSVTMERVVGVVV